MSCESDHGVHVQEGGGRDDQDDGARDQRAQGGRAPAGQEQRQRRAAEDQELGRGRVGGEDHGVQDREHDYPPRPALHDGAARTPAPRTPPTRCGTSGWWRGRSRRSRTRAARGGGDVHQEIRVQQEVHDHVGEPDVPHQMGVRHTSRSRGPSVASSRISPTAIGTKTFSGALDVIEDHPEHGAAQAKGDHRGQQRVAERGLADRPGGPAGSHPQRGPEGDDQDQVAGLPLGRSKKSPASREDRASAA